MFVEREGDQISKAFTRKIILVREQSVKTGTFVENRKYTTLLYIRKGYSIDFVHLKERSLQSGYTGTKELTKDVCIDLLKKRIESTKIEMVKADVSPFVRNMKDLDVWSTDYFLQLADMVKFE